MAKKPTLRDIAKHAEVALSTVSQVLNNKPGVSPEMRQRVLAAANELGYRQTITLNTPIKPRLATVGLLTKRRPNDPLVINPFYSYIIAGTERECQRHNISLMYANLEVDEDNRAQNWPAMLLDQRVDGVIVLGAFLEETIARISRQAGQNIVLVDSYASGETIFDSVLIDNYNGATTAVSYLIENGHRHIGLIGGHPQSYPSIQERRQAYFDVLRRYGITDTYVENCALDRSAAFEATLRLMSRAPELTAIFACNDDAVIGVMNALQNSGLDVPGDVSVIGFDDIDLAQEVTPTLTTIHVDKVMMGAMALRLLRDRFEDPDRPALRTLVTTQLIVRDSVQNLNA